MRISDWRSVVCASDLRRVVFDVVNVINGEANLRQALIKDKANENLYILAASQTRDKEALSEAGVERVLTELSKDFDYIVCDSPAGIERGAHLRSEERRVGKEWVRTCRSRWSPYH